MELFNAIFETIWTFSGTVILTTILGLYMAAAFCGVGRLCIVKIIKQYNKEGK